MITLDGDGDLLSVIEGVLRHHDVVQEFKGRIHGGVFKGSWWFGHLSGYGCCPYAAKTLGTTLGRLEGIGL